MSITYSLIRQLNMGLNSCHLRVHITRIWAANIYDKTTNRHDEFIGYSLLLLDEEGTQILASIGKHICGKFIPRLEEGSLYTVHMFDVRNAKLKFRIVDNNFAIHFLQTTVVECTPSEGLPIPLHKFDLVPFAQLSVRMGTVTNLTDVIGRLHSSTKVEMVGLGGTLKRRLIHLDDSTGERIEIAMLGDRVKLISDSDLVGTPPVLVVTLALIKSYNVTPHAGSLSICSTSATRIFRNPELPLTMMFQRGPPDAARPAKLVARPARQLTYASLAERRRTLLELVAYCDDPEEREAVFYSQARVTRVKLENGWCYPSCDSHNKMVTTLDNKFNYPSCNDEPPKTWLRYRLELEVQDPQSVVTFTLFDNAATKLLSITVEELSLSAPEAMTPETMPPQMKALLGLKLLFCVALSKFNFCTSKRSFTVLKTYTEQEIPKPPIAVPDTAPAALPANSSDTPNPVGPNDKEANANQAPLIARIKIEGEERPPKRLRESSSSSTPPQEFESSTQVDVEAPSSHSCDPNDT